MKTYRPSGKFSPIFVAMILVGAALAVASAWLYQFLVNFIPLIYVNFLITMGFAYGLSVGLGRLVRMGRCRNAIVAVAAALLIGGVAAGASHYFNYRLSFDEAAESEHLTEAQADRLADDLTFARFISLRVDSGWNLGKIGRSGDGAPISGVFVWLMWAIEALILMGGAVVGAFEAARRPYCEGCGEWSEQSNAFMFAAPSENTLDAVRSAATVDGLLDVDLDPTGALNEGLLFQPAACPACADRHYLSIIHRTVTLDKDDKEDVDDTNLQTNVILTPEQAESVEDIRDGLTVVQDDEINDWADEAAEDPRDADAPGPAESDDAADTADSAETPETAEPPRHSTDDQPDSAVATDGDGTW